MTRKKFLRGKWRTYSKLGRGRKKKQRWRKPRGRHNKIREKKKGNPKRVSMGYKKQRAGREETKIIRNIKDLEMVKKGERVIIAKIGKKKKIELIKKSEDKKVEVININIKKFLKKAERQEGKGEKKIKEEKAKKAEEKKSMDRKEGKK